MTIDVIGRAADGVRVEVDGVLDLAAVGLLRRRLGQLLDSGASSVVVDLSAVGHCDIRVLAVLDRVRRRLHAVHGSLDVRGLDPESLTGFTEATLREVLAAYRASPGVARRTVLWELGGAVVPGTCNDAERRIAQVCAGLVGGDGDVADVAERLTEGCARYLGMDATVLLPSPDRRPGGLVVTSASSRRARTVSEVGVATGEGPGVRCAQAGEPVSAPDLADWAQQWPQYVGAARDLGVRAARALPLRLPQAPPGPVSGTTIGSLGLLSGQTGPMAPADLGVARAFADLATVALASAWERMAERHGVAVVAVHAAAADQTVVEQAKGVLAERHRLTLGEADTLLHERATSRDLHIAEVARAVLTGMIEVLDPVPIRPVADQHLQGPASSGTSIFRDQHLQGPASSGTSIFKDQDGRVPTPRAPGAARRRPRSHRRR